MIKGKKIAIFGFGKEGVAAANYLASDNQIFIFDEKPKGKIEKEYFKELKFKDIKFYFKASIPQRTNFDLVVHSPGARHDNQILKKLLRANTKLTSSTRIFFDECPCQIIGVTGTKGKGTTSTLIQKMLQTQCKEVYLGGNIGVPALEILPKLTSNSLVILELSSFQLIDLHKSPQIAVVLLVTSEHLNWHTNDKEYQLAKLNIVSHQSKDDFAVINKDFEISASFAQKTKANKLFFSTKAKVNGAYIKDGIIISEVDGYEEICKAKSVLLPGSHNLQNVLAAIVVAKIKGIKSKNIAQILSTFKGLIHRLQLVSKMNGVKFYNDSFSTIPETTIAAIKSFKEPKILILGGSSKKSDFTVLAKTIISDKTVKALILIGEEAETLKKAIKKSGYFGRQIIENARTTKEIVAASKEISKPGDVVILSPACASFDMFKNYQDRGNQFIEEVLKLKNA